MAPANKRAGSLRNYRQIKNNNPHACGQKREGLAQGGYPGYQQLPEGAGSVGVPEA